MVFEMVFSPFNHLTQLVVQGNFIILNHQENTRSYTTLHYLPFYFILMDSLLYIFIPAQ